MKPFIKLVKTPNSYYFYDVNTNSIVNIGKEEYDYLKDELSGKKLEKKNDNIEELRNSGLLSDKRICKMIHPETEHIEYYLDRHINQITLQITQCCNLRCSYCAYSNDKNELQRNHSNKRMSMEVAKKAIDFLLEHSCDSEEIIIGFYGGEPFLEYDFIKEIVIYVNENVVGKKVRFSVTTNGTLIDIDKVSFLIDNNTSIMISVDGPQRIHDMSRKFESGKGTFDVICKNIEELYRKYGSELKKYISINMVINPSNDFDEIDSIFDKEVFRNVEVRTTIVDDLYIDNKTRYSEKYICKYRYHLFCAMIKQLSIVKNIHYSPMLEGYLAKMNKNYEDFKETYKCLPDIGAPSGPCIPGKRRLFVNTDGEFYPCERVSENSDIMNIGSLDKGFEFEKIIEIMNIVSLTEEQCRNCFATSKCTICARLADDKGKLSSEKKIQFCDSVRADVEQSIREVILRKEYYSFYRRQEV